MSEESDLERDTDNLIDLQDTEIDLARVHVVNAADAEAKRAAGVIVWLWAGFLVVLAFVAILLLRPGP